MLTHWVWSETL